MLSEFEAYSRAQELGGRTASESSRPWRAVLPFLQTLEACFGKTSRRWRGVLGYRCQVTGDRL